MDSQFHREDGRRPGRIDRGPLLQELKGQLGRVDHDDGVSEHGDGTEGTLFIITQPLARSQVSKSRTVQQRGSLPRYIYIHIYSIP